jgi:hypothetical protein
MHQRLLRAARPFARPSQPVLPVYELIVTAADRSPGKDRDYSHDIVRADVRRYVQAARRNGALLLLDIQPGRSDFLTVARRWQWVLEEPHVGLAPSRVLPVTGPQGKGLLGMARAAVGSG